MKPLTKEQIAALARKVDSTQERELNCTECHDFAAEFVERELAGLPLDEALKKVEHHLMLCPDCREELLALKKILQAGK